MRKKIFYSIALVGTLVFIASVVLIMGVLYTHFLNEQFDQMRTQAALAAQGVDRCGESYFDDLSAEGCRLTWIGSDGTVIYDSEADVGKMENHLQREEVKEAMEEGRGQSSRYSTTLLERRLYVTQKASDGSVIRVSDSQRSILGLLLGMLQPILIMAVIAFGASFLLAWRLTNRIIRPLNEIDLNHPESNDSYEELRPVLDRLRIQQAQLAAQNRELQQKQREFKAATSNMEEGLLILNSDMEIISVNRAATEILDISRYAAGQKLKDVGSFPHIEELFRQTLGGDRNEAPLEIGDRQYRLYASPVMSSESVTAVVIFMLDVTQRNLTEQLRREFTANVSHELKTPLQTISGSAELLAEGLVKPEDTAEFAARIHTESKRLIALIDDIIGLSRLDEETGLRKKEEIDLFAVAEHGVSQMAAEAKARGIGISLTGRSVMVSGDLTLLESVVHNLCDNAIKYSESGSGVEIQVDEVKDMAVLTVTDHGIGIPKEDQERIFERFYRVDKSRSKAVGGTGLGLSIVKHAVQHHEGTIELESEPGEGTTIRVKIPVLRKKR